MMKKLGFLLLLVFWGFLNTSCSYLVKNEKNVVYSKPKYGEDKFVVVKGYKVHYVEVGEGQPILLIPGAFSTYRGWNRMLPLLSEHYKVLAIDYVGAGDSDKPPSGFGYTIEEQADIIAGMVDQLQLVKPYLVGVSYGGGIALNMGARYKEKVSDIVCIEGNGGMKHDKVPYRPMEAFLKWPLIGHVTIGVIRSGLVDKLVAKLVMGNAWPSMSEGEKKEIIEIISQNNKTASRISWYQISRTLETSRDFAEDTKTIQVPILYLHGENSGYRKMAEVNIDFFKSYLPKTEIITVKDGIHDLELQKPEEVAALILNFLNKNRTNGTN